MKKIYFSFVLLLATCHWNSWANGNNIAIQQLEIDSSVLGEKRNLVVYLPENYQQSDARFPVLYLTDGDVQGPHTAGTLDYLAKFEQTPSMIVVGIVNPRDKRERDLTLADPAQQNSQQLVKSDRFLAFVEQEVIPLVKKQFRTLDYQALSGTSFGGQFALHALIKRPGLFDGVIAISPSLYTNNHQMLALVEAALKNKQLQGRLYLSIANEEPAMTEPFQKLLELIQRYPTDKLAVTNQLFAHETHNTTVLQGQYHGLKYLFAGWAIPESPQTLADLQAVFAKRSKLLNIPLSIPEDRAAGYGQWLQYLNRQQDALALLQWNRQTYPQSLHSHTSLIQAYVYFKLVDEAEAAITQALQSVKGLSEEQQTELKSLLP